MRQRISEKYCIEESFGVFSFKPFYGYRHKKKWLLLSILVFGSLTTYFYLVLNEGVLIVCIALLLIEVWRFIKIIIFDTSIRYSFDRHTNTVYRSSVIARNEKVMKLDDVVVFRSSDDDDWRYCIGKKKYQFVQNYPISIFFDGNKNYAEQLLYEEVILSKIELFVSNRQDVK